MRCGSCQRIRGRIRDEQNGGDVGTPGSRSLFWGAKTFSLARSQVCRGKEGG